MPGHLSPVGETLPDGTTNGEYVSTLLAANAGGPVTFSVGGGELPPGLSLEPTTLADLRSEEQGEQN